MHIRKSINRIKIHQKVKNTLLKRQAQRYPKHTKGQWGFQDKQY